MALRTFAAAFFASLALTSGLAGTASARSAAASGDNSAATVEGTDGFPAAGNGQDCGYGNLCLYTGPNYTGTRFDLYVCRDYQLAQWNGIGSAINNQTDGTVARFKDINYTVLYAMHAPNANPSIDFSPMWYANNC